MFDLVGAIISAGPGIGHSSVPSLHAHSEYEEDQSDRATSPYQYSLPQPPPPPAGYMHHSYQGAPSSPYKLDPMLQGWLQTTYMLH